MVISNYSMPDSSKIDRSSKSTTTTIKTEKIKEVDEKKDQENNIDPSIITQKELEEKEYQKEVLEKKLKENLEEKNDKDIAVLIAPEENIICLAVDGRQTNKDAFEIILKEFLNPIHDSVLICPHIYSNLHDDKFNWRFQKAHVMEYYKTKLITSIVDHQRYLIIQDRDTYKLHEIEQAYKIAEINQAKYFSVDMKV